MVSKEHHVTSRTVYWHLSPEQTGTVTDILVTNDPKVTALRDKYMDEEWMIKPEDPSIKATADEMMEGTGGNVYAIMKNTYNFLDTKFTYRTGVQILPKDAPDTLADKWGDCDDQSILMASIFRACGIPAWLEIGGLYDRGAATPAWGGHAWLKVWVPMLDGNGKFDPAISGTVDIDVVNDQFMFRDCYRYAEWESDGDGDHLLEYYQFISYFGAPEVSIDWESNIIREEGSVRYITSGGEVAATPGFGVVEAMAAIATLAVMGTVARRRRKS